MSNVKTKRPRGLPEMFQPGFGFEELGVVAETNEIIKRQNIGFREGNPNSLFVGDRRLENYLRDNGFGFVIKMTQYLKEYDYSEFIKSYSPTGRHAIHPRIILGLIIYGILYKQWSLRELENLAIKDLCAWWVCGGLQPDHSTIGQFLQQHAELLQDDFFITFTHHLVRALNLKSYAAAGDGTTIEAASSRFRVLKKEAAQLAAKEAQKEATLDPENIKKKTKAHLTLKAAKKAENREQELKKVGKAIDKVCVSQVEPEAAVQPLKNNVSRPSYKPSILVDENKLIVGQYVHPTNENIAIKPMLEQYKDINGHLPKCTLLDAGYHNVDILQTFVKLDLDVLCPSGTVDKTGEWEKESKNQIAKKNFKYDEEKDVYICPQGKELVPSSGGTDANRRKFQMYQGKECENCPLRIQCTKSKRGRSIKRYEGEELKEAMAQVLQDSRAQEKYKKRKVMVEPAFAEIKERQGLKRFHRIGLSKVRIEFALHCVAFNVKKASRLEEELSFALFILYWRENEGSWKIHSLYFRVFSS